MNLFELLDLDDETDDATLTARLRDHLDATPDPELRHALTQEWERVTQSPEHRLELVLLAGPKLHARPPHDAMPAPQPQLISKRKRRRQGADVAANLHATAFVPMPSLVQVLRDHAGLATAAPPASHLKPGATGDAPQPDPGFAWQRGPKAPKLPTLDADPVLRSLIEEPS